MEVFIAMLGFSLAAYAVVGNDCIQTLGTFLASNDHRPWWQLWLFAGGIMAVVLLLGFNGMGDILGGENAADLTFGKYGSLFDAENPFPELNFWYVLPPLVLLSITRFGIPVSTTFLVLSFFSIKSLPSMLMKSIGGYGVAFLFAALMYVILSRITERYFMNHPMAKSGESGGLLRSKPFWTALQWLSTGFLWSQWLTADLVNILVYLGDPKGVGTGMFAFALMTLLALLGLIFFQKGGKIQEIVLAKSNTTDIRAATFIDFFYALVLLFFKYDKLGLWDGGLPMSTTWVFLGMLAGREVALRTIFRVRNVELSTREESSISNGNLAVMVFSDLGKATIGLVVSILLVILLYFVEGRDMNVLW
jgi:hypothetical protein